MLFKALISIDYHCYYYQYCYYILLLLLFFLLFIIAGEPGVDQQVSATGKENILLEQAVKQCWRCVSIRSSPCSSFDLP